MVEGAGNRWHQVGRFSECNGIVKTLPAKVSGERWFFFLSLFSFFFSFFFLSFFFLTSVISVFLEGPLLFIFPFPSLASLPPKPRCVARPMRMVDQVNQYAPR